MQEFKTIKNEVSNEITEKKSRFITNIFYVETETEAINKINNIKSKYHDARHNCYAYRIIAENGIKERSSDDGEPGGTAGAPILNVITKNNLVNVLIIVTRYFGGILLGAGGLVRAYSESASEIIEKIEKVVKEPGYITEIEISYQDLEKVKYLLKSNKIKINNNIYEENVKLVIEVNEKFKVEIENYTSPISKYIKNFIFLDVRYVDK